MKNFPPAEPIILTFFSKYCGSQFVLRKAQFVIQFKVEIFIWLIWWVVPSLSTQLLVQ